MRIQAKRFILRSFRWGDERSIVAHINNRMIARNTLHIPYPYTMRDARAWIRENVQVKRSVAPRTVNCAIVINGDVSGGIGLHKIEPRHKAELGYWLAEQYWGTGIMTEAVRLVTKFGFEKLRLQRVYACVFPWNRASMRVLEKAGYVREGILRKQARKGKRFLDEYLYAKIRQR